MKTKPHLLTSFCWASQINLNPGGDIHLSVPCLLAKHLRKCDYHHAHSGGCSTQDSHVFLPPEFLLLLRSFLHIHFYSKASTSLTTGKKYISFSGCLTQYFFAIFLGATDFYLSGFYVLWPLCGHLQTPALPDHHEQQSLHTTCVLLLARGALAILPPIILISQMNTLLEAACSDTSLLELIVIFLAAVTLRLLWC